MKIPSAHLQMVSNKCTNFQKNPCIHFLKSFGWKERTTNVGKDVRTELKQYTPVFFEAGV